MSKIDYRDKTVPLDKRLQTLEGGLAMACNDAAADLVREARDALTGATLDREEIDRLRSCLQSIELHELRDHEDYEHIQELAEQFRRDSISRDRATPPRS